MTGPKYDLGELEMYFFGGTCTLPVDKRRAILRDLLILVELRQMQAVGKRLGLGGWYKTLNEILTNTERRVAEREADRV